MPNATVGFRPTAEDQRILDALTRTGMTTADALRHGLRLVERERWVDRARSDAERLHAEDLSGEPDAW
ncbi:hypothetical protein V5D56_08175 [Cellulosimicrobium sp. PMB13]|uniref:hypothetical protein n=1 Tax=Cellulosimicrobium sp. PMB13 TaxID=3120158 RepID=UPI003F4B5785